MHAFSTLGAAQYFGDGWCRFDFFLVCISLLDQIAHEALAAVLPVPPFLLRVMRLVRILRLLRLLKGAKELRSLLVTLVLSFPPLLNVASLLAMVIFVYAVLGLQLFSFVAHGDSIDAQRNFETLGSGALLLFQVDGRGWPWIAVDCRGWPWIAVDCCGLLLIASSNAPRWAAPSSSASRATTGPA